ncbi:hypothetical protein [Aureimonas sp. ME7]|uniref:hypothetical protein n=1 Tax=Aureimonas sp. ME7 TaxID=2744252 RepID=UPI0015F68FF9|nr:hypothetical protein [Aureimonas sp. ME7]
MTELHGKTPDAFEAQPALSIADLLMGGMVRCDQMGMYAGLGHMLRVHGHSFKPPQPGDEEEGHRFGTFCHLRSRYLEARDTELRFGKGALLNLDHPDVATLVRNHQLLSDREIEAAKTFSEANPVFYASWRAEAATMPSASGKGPAIWVPLGS